MSEKDNFKSKLGAWESRASISGPNKVSPAAVGASSTFYSPQYQTKKKLTINTNTEDTATKSTRQAIQDLALFASPRVVQKKLDVKNAKSSLPDATLVNDDDQQAPGATTFSKSNTSRMKAKGGSFNVHELQHNSDKQGAASIAARANVFEKRKVTIKDRAKLFGETKQQSGAPGAPLVPMMHGKRTSVLDKFYAPGTAPAKHGKRASAVGMFTPPSGRKVYQPQGSANFSVLPLVKSPSGASAVTTPKPTVTSQKPEWMLKKQQLRATPSAQNNYKGASDEEGDGVLEIFSRKSLRSVSSPTKPTQTPQKSIKAEEPVTKSPETAEEAKEEPKIEKKPDKIDRKHLVSQEMAQIIKQAEDEEIEDDMDEEVIEVLHEAAVLSNAYSKKWYDVFTDSFIHCPSLATTLIDYTLLEIAEELYGEEIPMLYTVSLRAVAVEMAKQEEEVPDYIFDMAS